MASGMFWLSTNGDGMGKNTGSMKIFPFSTCGIQLSLCSRRLFYSHCLTKKKQHKTSCIPFSIGEFECFSFTFVKLRTVL